MYYNYFILASLPVSGDKICVWKFLANHRIAYDASATDKNVLDVKNMFGETLWLKMLSGYNSYYLIKCILIAQTIFTRSHYSNIIKMINFISPSYQVKWK